MHTKRVLIAADDPHTGAWIQRALEAFDLRMQLCAVKELGRQLAEHDLDLVIADVGHSPADSVYHTEKAVARGAELKLLVVVEAGALGLLRLPVSVTSDFLVRGATSEELAARARRLLWPGEEVSEQELVRIGEMTLNLATYQASLRGVPVDFTYLEYALFAFLVTHPGRTYSREVLLRRVWGAEYYGGARTVDVHVRRIRSKIGAELSRRLETVRNVGYLWNG
ncbi:MAG: winged-helix domain-containing protein [Coriobacteriia bacterium]